MARIWRVVCSVRWEPLANCTYNFSSSSHFRFERKTYNTCHTLSWLWYDFCINLSFSFSVNKGTRPTFQINSKNSKSLIKYYADRFFRYFFLSLNAFQKVRIHKRSISFADYFNMLLYVVDEFTSCFCAIWWQYY